MTNDSTTDEESVQSIDSESLAVTSTYKILGEFSADNGVGVLGQNNASSGTPIGVQGAVPNADGYGLATPDDASVGGTLELDGNIQASTDLNMTVSGGTRALTLEEPNTDANGDTAGANVVAGHPDNTVANDAAGCVIAGGGLGGSFKNVAFDHYCTISGGKFNEAGEFSFDDDNDPSTNQYATVSGGRANSAVATGATVGGGESNNARGDYATVPGGDSCIANAYCFAAGRRAKTQGTEQGVFLWADSEDADFQAADTPNGSGVAGNDTFKARAGGGVLFVTSGGSTYIPGNSSGWSTASSRAMKTNIDPIEPEQALDGVEELEIATWEYEDEDGKATGTTHIGPMAEEFHDAFDVGSSDEHINSINADGAAFAAIQGLADRLEQKAERIEELETEVEAKDEQLDELRTSQQELREENEQLRDRTAALEARLDAIEDRLDPDQPTTTEE